MNLIMAAPKLNHWRTKKMTEILLAFMREKLRESGDPHLVQLESELNDSQLLTVIKAFSSDDSTEAVDSA